MHAQVTLTHDVKLEPKMGKRRRGRPRKTWRQTFRGDLDEMGITFGAVQPKPPTSASAAVESSSPDASAGVQGTRRNQRSKPIYCRRRRRAGLFWSAAAARRGAAFGGGGASNWPASAARRGVTVKLSAPELNSSYFQQPYYTVCLCVFVCNENE